MLLSNELLDRFELLHPDSESLKDLRRAYIDKDLSSIFRLSDIDDDYRKAIVDKNLHAIFRILPEQPVSGTLEDLRKAILTQNIHSLFRLIDSEELRKCVVENNLHSIFRLIDDSDLRKFILEDNTYKLWPLLKRYTNTEFVNAFKSLHINNMQIANDCFSRGQLLSKIWLINELKNINLSLGNVFLCAGWYATLSVMLFESGLHIRSIRSFDIDETCADIAETFNKFWVKDDWKFKAVTQDIKEINFSQHTFNVKRSDGTMCEMTEVPDTIINTSCEHIDNFDEWFKTIPKNKLVVLQSNNYFDIVDHVNCHESLQQFEKSTQFTKELFSGELELEKYTRYMRIGFK